MLGNVIHLKSPPAETSERTLYGIVEGQNRARLLRSLDIQPEPQSRLRWVTKKLESPRWGEELNSRLLGPRNPVSDRLVLENNPGVVNDKYDKWR